jgi:hypothetical protein
MVFGFAIALSAAACANPSVHKAAAPLGSPSPVPTTSAYVPTETATCDKTQPAPDLCNATVDVPSWGLEIDTACPHGPVTFVAGRYTGHKANPFEGIMKVHSGDVDHDGVAEEIVLASCQVGDPSTDQVFVVDHTASGALHTLGQVIAPKEGFNFQVHDIAAAPDGSVRLNISNVLGSDSQAEALEVLQWRTYSWNGRQFVQTAGSTSFEASHSANSLSMSMKPVVAIKPEGGLRHATVTITVHNSGTNTAAATLVRLTAEPWFRLVPGPCDPQGMENTGESCPVDLPAGATRTITFDATITVADTAEVLSAGGPNSDVLLIQLRLGDQSYSHISDTITFQ